MAFQPDIVVTNPDSPKALLVAEVKTGPADVAAADAQLRAYMASMGCPTGLLVTPERIRLYRHTYTGYSLQAVQLVAGFPTRDVLAAVGSSTTYSGLERLVQEWLEDLKFKQHTLELPSHVREPIEENLLPALAAG